MARIKKVDSKEAGLEIGLHFFKFFLKSEHLHYGYFKDLEADISNLVLAQEKYVENLMAVIPNDVTSILDVGCGSGKFAETLIADGYDVDVVAPGNQLSTYAKEKLGDKCILYNSKFEDVKTDKKYDLILFSESFQYISMKKALDGSIHHLNENGYILIADFFKTDTAGKSLLGGGHDYAEWLNILESYTFTFLTKEDITEYTAPTVDLVDQLSKEVLEPSWKVAFDLAADRFPLALKFLKWKYKKKLDKMENKHFTGQRTGSNFKLYKKYMLYVLQQK
jgi:2-polyprenyl-3-methyl-5-hydroxy-6-metoxy-1,4-benzoquinol methylase